MRALLNDLLSTGQYAELYKAGIINPKFATYLDITLFVDAQIKARGIKKTKAVLEASVMYEVSERTVYAAIKTCNS